jgi:nucleoid-associated protein YgaU
MGRDKVLGLSLAILLIGFAGAFCFRNEPFVENGLKLARAKILDEGIAQRPGPKPYVVDSKAVAEPIAKPAVTLGGIEPIEPAESPKMAQQSDRDSSPAIQPEPRSPSDAANPRTAPIEQFVSDQKERSAPESESTAATPTASAERLPELTIRPNSAAFAPPDSLLEDSMKWQHPPDGRDGCPAMTRTESESSETSAPITYRVRRGDTLTKIAQHVLGDSNRYREIFEANREQLQSPNARLKVGMTLQIPADPPHSKRAASAAATKSKSARPNTVVGGSSRNRQVPVRPVGRIRELSNHPPKKDDSSALPSVDEPQEATGKPRFVPVQRAPFLRSNGESNSANPRGRDLSQRAPLKEEESDASDRGADRKADASPSDASQTPSSSKQEGDSSTMGTEGSEGK